MTELKGKSIKLGSTDNIAYIDSIDGDNYVTTYGFRIKISSVKPYNVDGIDFISLPSNPVIEDGAPEIREAVELTVKTDYTDTNVYITVKNRNGEYKVVKTTDKTVHFIDHENNDKKRYVGLAKVKRAFSK